MAITEFHEIEQGLEHYKALLEWELTVPSHHYDAVKINELRQQIKGLKEEKEEWLRLKKG